jgi:hypothetical protein
MIARKAPNLCGMPTRHIRSDGFVDPAFRLALSSRGTGKDLVALPKPSQLTIEQRRGMQLLAEAPNGYTEAALRARGVTPTLLVELAAYGYVVARP